MVYVPEISGSRAYGATRWLSPTKALIQLSLRGKRDDVFWFTFVHEAAHPLFHGKRQTFVEGKSDEEPDAEEYDSRSDEEEEANRFAADFLIPPGSLETFRPVGTKPRRIRAARVVVKAMELGVAPGVLVGRLHHEGWLERSHLQYLRKSVKLEA